MYLKSERFYRNSNQKHSTKETEQELRILIEESDLFIKLTSAISKEEILSYIKEQVLAYRQILKEYIDFNPSFLHSLNPIEYKKLSTLSQEGQEIIKEMCEAGKIFNVGPFAAVAGTIAEYIARSGHRYLEKKALKSDILVENGGDIFLISQEERHIVILDKPETFNDSSHYTFKIKIPPITGKAKGKAICASSAHIGHSLSFGNADLVAIIAEKGSLADAAATSLCNKLKSPDDFPLLIQEVEEKNISGLFASCQGKFLLYGDIELA